MLNWSVVYAFLQNTTTMLMASNLAAFILHFIIDKLFVCCLPASQDFKNHVVSVYLMTEFYDVLFQEIRQFNSMFLMINWFWSDLYQLLHTSGSMHSFAKVNDSFLHLLDNLHKLVIIAQFHHFLCKVVAKRVIHQQEEVWNRFLKNDLDESFLFR